MEGFIYQNYDGLGLAKKKELQPKELVAEAYRFNWKGYISGGVCIKLKGMG